MYKIRAFRAIDEPETCKIYLKKHVQVLLDYGITNITSNNEDWMKNPGTYCVIINDLDDEMVAGIRVQIKNDEYQLPVELAVGYIDKNVHKLVESFQNNGGIGELCGLWNSKQVKKVGTSVILVRAAVAMTSQLKFETLTGICSDYSMKMFTDVGFVVDRTLGKNGDFFYPNEETIARVVGILNAKKLETAAPFDKKQILNLRVNPVQTKIETGPKGDFKVFYNMIISTKQPSLKHA